MLFFENGKSKKETGKKAGSEALVILSLKHIYSDSQGRE